MVARDVGVSAFYLTQLFKHVEGIPLYRSTEGCGWHRVGIAPGSGSRASAWILDFPATFISHGRQRAYGRTPNNSQGMGHEP